MLGRHEYDHSCSRRSQNISSESRTGKTPNIYFRTFTQERRHKVHKQNCTIALCPHVNMTLLRCIQKQLETYIRYETLMKQAGLRNGHGTREQIANVSESWTAQGSTTKMSHCFDKLHKRF